MNAKLRDWLLGLIDRKPRIKETAGVVRGAATHVVILDGTMSSLRPGCETNAGIVYKLLREQGYKAGLTVYYEAGIQWRDWSSTWDVVAGRGINRQISRAYGVLCSRYKPGDRIVLIGYSRGAFAVRSLAGVIGEIGLLRAECATERNITQAYRHYRADLHGDAAKAFSKAHCYPFTEIEAVAVWDTVKALGLKLPVLWRWTKDAHEFHNHRLGHHVRNGFHALALNETREAYEPVLWDTTGPFASNIEQVWFRGCHGDVGGQVLGHREARPLANIPLTWMLSRLEMCRVPLPDGWRGRFPVDAEAPSAGNWKNLGWIMLSRRKRKVGRDPSEAFHDTVPSELRRRYAPQSPEMIGEEAG